MLEIGVFGVILLAAGYWTTMFIMGRRDDVLHGKFVRFEEQGDPAGAAMPAPPPRFPGRPVGAAPQPQAPEQKTRSADSAALESLLAAIQQDLKSVA